MSYKKGLETKKIILKGSKELFLSEGFEKSTFKKIGDYLNINSNLITYHFSNKKTLAKYALIDFIQAENNFVAKFVLESYSPMLFYTIRNRIHCQILAQNPNIFRFYSEAVSYGLLHNTLQQIPYVKKLYQDFFAYYNIKKQYDDSYFMYLELGSEREILLHFKPEMAKDEVFIKFISSIFPRVIGLEDKVIDESLILSKKLCEEINIENFVF